ncbi:MAG: hypothetical protein K8S13_25000 [Desulfobacula sp.]|uniref:hypothetical protein n=1 Tax=Desulfobacula sp. TaxID=2593537 RepID=UPI0025C51AD5|nr:hypothetical protein [Desulfobacula sp.]MCD4723087.1 hypothetical protein [Desulfobacula sp.]
MSTLCVKTKIYIDLSKKLIRFIAVLLGWISSVSLSRRFVAPLVELKKRVNAIIAGNLDSNPIYKYPENKIGTIATDIEQLTDLPAVPIRS